MLTKPEQLRLIDRIYEGAFTDCGWAGALGDIAVAFRSETANIATVGLSTGRLRAISFVGIEPGYQSTYSALAGLPDMQRTYQRLAALISARVVTDEDTQWSAAESVRQRVVASAGNALPHDCDLHLRAVRDRRVLFWATETSRRLRSG
jgi:hypothetical protein